ncbi:MAG: serine hydrolase [Ignavibacteria bacterium]|nr:serine hydrolase [Ignavibacteria bacterium]
MNTVRCFDVINDPIPASVPEPYAGAVICELCSGNTGMEHHSFTFDELVGLVSRYQLSVSPPGLSAIHSNTGYNILGKIIERASGLTWDGVSGNEFL